MQDNARIYCNMAAVVSIIGACLIALTYYAQTAMAMDKMNDVIELPAPRQDSDYSLERALRERRSVRQFSRQAITVTQLSQILWAAQGITDPRGYRTAPSAGALYPLEVYVLVGHVTGLAQGLYHYQVGDHSLLKIADDDRRRQMERAALGQDWVSNNAVLLVFSAVDARTTSKYRQRGIRYVHIEAGHAAQNVMLQAQALGLGAAVVGAFDDNQVNAVLERRDNERPLYLLPVGKPR